MDSRLYRLRKSAGSGDVVYLYGGNYVNGRVGWHKPVGLNRTDISNLPSNGKSQTYHIDFSAREVSKVAMLRPV